MEPGFLVTPKDNQMILHYERYNIKYIVEFNHVEGGRLEVTYLFDPASKLSTDQKQEIIDETKEDILETL